MIDPPHAPARAVTPRSAVLGTLSVIAVCAISPYNDFVVANGFLVGNYFPPYLMGLFFMLAVFVNAPLHRWRPAWALSSGELAVIMAMTLVACCFPGQGLMRQFLPTLVAPFYLGRGDGAWWSAFVELKLPSWLFPVEEFATGRGSDIVSFFYGRVPPEDSILPYLLRWVVPLCAWGIFFFALFATLLALSTILRRQWAVNERLAFPLAQLEVALIESPPPGRSLNALFANRVFWIGLAGVFVVHSIDALNKYFPKHIPLIPLSFNLTTLMTEEPWTYAHPLVKSATVYLTFVGITYFIQARAGFSLWFFLLLQQAITMQSWMRRDAIPDGAWQDQHLGACIAFVIGFAWIGRHHFASVFRQAFGLGRRNEDTGEYLPYALAFWIAVAGTLVMLAFLLLLGVKLWVALGILFFLLLGHVVIARIVAETGLSYMRCNAMFPQVFTNMPATLFSGRDMYFAGMFNLCGPIATRESLLPFALHGLTANENARDDVTPRQRRGLLALMAWAVLLGYFVAAFASLACYYSHATPLARGATHVLNPVGADPWPRYEVNARVVQQRDGRFGPKAHNSWGHMAVGLGVGGFLQFATLRWASWPLMPVGYLVGSTHMIYMMWFSIFIGWLAKVLILQFGGASLFQRLKPLFVGVIFGESLAAIFWLMVSLVLAAGGYDYVPMLILPQ